MLFLFQRLSMLFTEEIFHVTMYRHSDIRSHQLMFVKRLFFSQKLIPLLQFQIKQVNTICNKLKQHYKHTVKHCSTDRKTTIMERYPLIEMCTMTKQCVSAFASHNCDNVNYQFKGKNALPKLSELLNFVQFAISISNQKFS